MYLPRSLHCLRANSFGAFKIFLWISLVSSLLHQYHLCLDVSPRISSSFFWSSYFSVVVTNVIILEHGIDLSLNVGQALDWQHCRKEFVNLF